MAKTFDNISEASATNYLFLFTQRTLALQDEPPTPPPLNALGLPCRVICRLWARLYREKAQDTVLAAETTAAVTVTLMVKAGVVELKLAVNNARLFTSSVKLAEKITEYILDHQDDAAQEDRWRTIMKRDITKSFHKLATDMQAQREEIRHEVREDIRKGVQGRLDDVLSKLDQLVEARATDARG